MNNLLSHKYEETIKQNSADFYTMTIFSKEILQLDSLRVNSFSKWRRDNTEKLKEGSIASHNQIKIITYLSISVFMMYKFKSFLVIPAFYLTYLVSKKIFRSSNNNYSHLPSDCYFCNFNQHKSQQMNKYEKYYRMINYVFDKNPQISNLKDFEREVDKILKENKIMF